MKRRGGAATAAAPRGGRSKRRRGATKEDDDEPSRSGDGDKDEQLDANAAAAVLPAPGRTAHEQLDPALLADYAARAAAVLQSPGEGDGSSSSDDAAGSESDADHDGTGGGDTEGPRPAAVPDIHVAAAELTRLTGISPDTALSALKETQDKVLGENASGPGAGSNGGTALLQTWLEEAQIWLACNMEVQGEIEDVRAAMQESLQEYEAAKAADDVPLVERPPDYLRERFLPTAGSSAALAGAPRSVLLLRLACFACPRALLSAGSHKAALVKLAELECKCRRWYPNKGTSLFWEKLADECAAAAAADPALRQEGWICCPQGAALCSACAAALGIAADAGAAGPSTSAPAATSGPAGSPRSALAPEAAAEMLAAVGAFVVVKGPEVEREVCKMPGVSGQVPDIFAGLDDQAGEGAGSDGDEVVVLEAEQRPANGRVGEVVDEL